MISLSFYMTFSGNDDSLKFSNRFVAFFNRRYECATENSCHESRYLLSDCQLGSLRILQLRNPARCACES